ncbi:ABC transporter permease [Actinomadura sp. PM05-2]|uniref:ABC transporter permease n=2 Tax=Actinomadura parmotrematis TaxID=2864039 RepID=A0ABS7FST3_9ACTN|nr:ABC transporter permease [Actinomadura parmotrematis]
MGRVTLRNLAAHKIRLVLTAVAVILGVAFVAGTLIFTDTMNGRFDQLFDKIGKDVAVQVRGTALGEGTDDQGEKERGPVPAALLAKVAAVPGVKNATGNVTGYAALVGRDGKIVGDEGQGAPQLGINYTPGALTAIVSGRAPAAGGEIAIGDAMAKKTGYQAGDRARVVTTSGVQPVTIVGVMDSGDMMGATTVAFDTATAQRLMLKPGYFTDITARSTGVPEDVLRARVARVLPAGTEAITGTAMRAESKDAIASFMGFFRALLLSFALVSIFVGAFIIFNTFSMLVAQRTRELALLRAIGAARAQVTRAVLGEALAVGVVGSTLGIAAGAGLAALLQGLIGSGGGLTVTATPIWVSYLVGVLVTVVSAYFPARRAAKIPPVAAMRDDVALPQRSLRVRVAAGALLTLAGAALIALGLGGDGGNPAAIVGAGAFGVFLGVTLLAPVISVPVVKVLGWPFTKLFGATGRLARQNALRNPRRTAATAAALMIGLALVTAVDVLGSSMRASVGAQIDQQFGADYTVSGTGGGGVSPADAKRVAAVPGVRNTVPVYVGKALFGTAKGNSSYIAGDVAALARAARLDMISGSARAGADGVLLDKKTAEKRGVAVGGTLTAAFADHSTVPLRVSGIYEKSDFLGGIIAPAKVYLAHADKPVVDTLVIDAGGATKAKTAALKNAVKDNPALKVQDKQAVKDQVNGQVDQFVNFLTILLVMSIVIAAVGVVNTLALSVTERTREIGLLRAIGISRLQLRRMIRVESIVIAVFGALLGMGIGVAFGAALQNALADDGLDVLAIPGGTLAIYLAIAAAIGVLAALWPAWRAGRMDVLKAISTE